MTESIGQNQQSSTALLCLCCSTGAKQQCPDKSYSRQLLPKLAADEMPMQTVLPFLQASEGCLLLAQVTTMRSKGSLKPIIPCMDDPVNKLEGLGEKTRKNLMDVRACAASLELTGLVPEDCPNSVTTGGLTRQLMPAGLAMPMRAG